MDLTLADWLDVTPSEWMERTMPGWREGYGDIMRTTPREWLEMVYAPFASQPLWTVRPLRRGRRRYRDWRCGCEDDREHRKPHRRDFGCPRCGSDPCECYCCVGDVDVVVYTRMGERRVVPISVANERRREKSIKLELSSWTTRGGDTGFVETVSLEPDEFTLEPCGEQDVMLVIEVPGKQPDACAGRKPTATDVPEQRKRRPDMDSCQVVTADLRLVGCDHRSVRIAAAILPRDCDPYRVSCGCTCC